MELPEDWDFLKDQELDGEIKKILVQNILEEHRHKRDATVERSRADKAGKTEGKRFWQNTPLVIALTGTITIAANAISGAFLNSNSAENTATLRSIEARLIESGKGADATRQANNEERQFSFQIIEKELSKSNDMTERASVLLFLARSGILNGLNRGELEKMALNDLRKDDPSLESVGIPITLGVPNYRLDIPKGNPEQTKSANLLLEIATKEINLNVEEVAKFEEVQKYWRAIPDFDAGAVTPATPWSGAFISWAILKAGNPDKLDLSAASYKILRSAIKAGININSAKREILPGDLIFIAQSDDDAILFSKENSIIPMSNGIVYASENNGRLEYIAGNIGDAVRLKNISLSDKRIVGFARIGQRVEGRE